MTDEVKNGAPDEETVSEQEGNALAEMQEALARAQQELDAMNDKYVRLVAEYDNFR